MKRLVGAGTGAGNGDIDVIGTHTCIRWRTNRVAEAYSGDETAQVVAGFVDATCGIMGIRAYGE